MKKNFFMLAATAALFAACAETDLVNELNLESNGQEIGFSTFASKVTRAENNQTDYKWSLKDHHTSFTVYAGKLIADPNGSATTHAVYSNSEEGTVSYLTEGGWTADPKKYWDKTATEYYFYAGAPKAAEWEFAMKNANDYSTGYLTYAGFTLKGENLADATDEHKINWSWNVDGVNDDIDLMIAAPCTVKRAAYNKATADVVNLQFNHILSRLSIKVAKGANIDADQELKLTSLVVFNMKSTGDFNEGNKAADQTPMIDRWTTGSTTYQLPACNVANAITDAIYTHQYLVIPQQVKFEDIDTSGISDNEEAYFRIDYTIAGEPYYAYYNLAHAFGQNVALNFQEGWENTLTITINPNTIVFDAKVSEWQDYVGNGAVIVN